GARAEGEGGTVRRSHVKAAVRDMKAYIRRENYRSIPVGYVNDVLQGSPAPVDSISTNAWDYLNCGDKSNDTIDFFEGNVVSYCEGSTFTDSELNAATQEFANYSIPIFLAAYGCAQALNRDFSEIDLIYGFLMSDTCLVAWSMSISSKARNQHMV
ncbi:MAG: hypothetical protein Q9204_000737, partial [Flavoplaca sp. TL-2023a]